MKKLGLPNVKFNVVGVVATNSFFWEGHVRDESPCFVHIKTLIELLADGGTQFGSLGPNDEAITFHTQCLENSGSSRVDAFAKALRNPPKAEAYGKCLALQDFHLPQLDETDIEGVHRGWIFNPPRLEEVPDLVASLSCAGNIVRTVD